MTTQRPEPIADPPVWDPPRLRQALAAARYHTARGGRRLHLTRPEREDLRQDILLAMLQRDRHFDPAKAAWSTFANLLARHVVADRIRAARDRVAPIFLALDVDGFPSGGSATQQDHDDCDMALSLHRLAEELPPLPRALLRQIGGAGDVPAAQRAATTSSASFYRGVTDLRFWLQASGMRPPRRRRCSRGGAAG